MKSCSRGFSVMEIVMSVGVLAVVVAAFSAVLINSSNMQSTALHNAHLEAFRQDMLIAMQSDEGWSNSIQASSTMGCLKTGQPCTHEGSAGAQPLKDLNFVLRDSTNQVLFDSSVSSNGLTVDGKPCSSFSPSSGNDSCPFRYDLKWSANCTPGNCVDPAVRVSADLIYSPQNKRQSINPARYSIAAFYRMPALSTAAGPPPPPLPPPSGPSGPLWTIIYNDQWCAGDFYYDILLHGQECKVNGGPIAILSGREKCLYNGRWLNTDGCPFHTCTAPREIPGTDCMGHGTGNTRLYSTTCSGNCCNFEWQYCN